MMCNDEFFYFFHGTMVKDSSLIDEIFRNGLLNYRGNNMKSTMWPMEIKEGELGKKLKEYSGIKGNAVFVIKIPKYYLTPTILNGQLQQIPLPIWKLISKNGEHGDISQFCPELVYGVYLVERDSFLQNPNYSPVHNPIGLQFDDQQIDYLLNNDAITMHDFAVSRNGKSFEELSVADCKSHCWDNALKQYSDHFKIDFKSDYKL